MDKTVGVEWELNSFSIFLSTNFL